MRKRILLIVIIIILIVFSMIGIWYSNFYDRKLSKNENTNSNNSMPENLMEPIQNDTNIVLDEINNDSNENVGIANEENSNTRNEENNTKSEVNTVTQENKKSTTTQTSTQSKSSSSNSNSQKTQTNEKVEKTTSTSTTNPTPTTNPEKSNNSKKDTTQNDKIENKVERCTNNNNHGMDVGNCGRWFNSKSEAVAYYEEKVNYWSNWWENADPNDSNADATYYKNCPTGYEYWSCMYCSKWTINLYYR